MSSKPVRVADNASKRMPTREDPIVEPLEGQVQESRQGEHLPASRSRRSMDAAAHFHKKLSKHKRYVGNDLWIGVGSDNAQSPKERDIPWNSLNQPESSLGSEPRPGPSAAQDQSPNKVGISRSRSNRLRMDDPSDDLEELRVLLSRKELEYERLANEFEHCSARWKLEVEDLQMQRDEAIAANRYLEEVIRGLKAEGICRDNLMKHMTKQEQTGSAEMKRVLEQFRQTSEDVRKSIALRDSELTAIRRSDKQMKKTLQKMSASELDRRSDDRSAGSSLSKGSRHSSRQSASAAGLGQSSNIQPLPLSRATANQAILIIDKESSERTLDSLESCYQKLKYQNGQFRRVLDTLATDRSPIVCLKERIQSLSKQNADPATFDKKQLRILQSTNSSLKQQLHLNDTTIAELRKRHQRVNSELRTKDTSLAQTHKRLESESLDKVHAQEELCIYRLKCEQLQNRIEELGRDIEEITKTNAELNTDIEQKQAQRGDFEKDYEHLRKTVNELQRGKLELEYQLSEAREALAMKTEEMKQEVFGQKIGYEAQVEELKSEVEFLRIGFDRSKDLETKLEDARKELREKEDVAASLKKQIQQRKGLTDNLTESTKIQNVELADTRAKLQQATSQLDGIRKEAKQIEQEHAQALTQLNKHLEQKQEAAKVEAAGLIRRIEQLTLQQSQAQQNAEKLQIKLNEARAAAQHQAGESSQHITEISLTLAMRDHQISDLHETVEQLEEGNRNAVAKINDLQLQLADCQASLKATNTQLEEAKAKYTAATAQLQQERQSNAQLRAQLQQQKAQADQLRKVVVTELETTQKKLIEQLREAEQKKEEISTRTDDITELLFTKNSEITELMDMMKQKEDAQAKHQAASETKIREIEESLRTRTQETETLRQQLIEVNASWYTRFEDLQHEHTLQSTILKHEKELLEEELRTIKEEKQTARKQFEQQLQTKERLIRDRSKSLEMLLADHNLLVSDHKAVQDRLKSIEEDLDNAERQLESSTLEDINRRLEIERMQNEVDMTNAKLSETTRRSEQSEVARKIAEDRITELARKLEEAHTLQLHLEQRVSDAKEQLVSAIAEQDKSTTQLNIDLLESQQQTATAQIELRLAREELTNRQMKDFEMEVALEKARKELIEQTSRVVNLTSQLEAKDSELRAERSMASSQSRQLLTAIDSLQEQQRQYQQTRDRVNSLEADNEALQRQIVEMTAEISDLKEANEAELIQIKEEYETSLSIIEQLRAAIVFLQNEKQKFQQEQTRHEGSALEISEIQDKSRNRADILEDLPKEMMQSGNVTKEESLTDQQLDEISYNEAIGQLIAKEVGKDSQLLIRPLNVLFRKLYGSPASNELVRACEEFLKGVNLYNQDMNSRFNHLRTQAKMHNSAVDTVLRQEPPKQKPRESESSRTKQPSVSKLNLSANVTDKTGSRSADRKEPEVISKEELEPKDNSGQSSSRVSRQRVNAERPSMFVSNNLEAILKQDEKDEQASVEMMERSMRISGERSPEDTSQHSKQPSEIKSEMAQAVKADLSSKIESSHIKAQINTYRRPTTKKSGKK